MFVSKMVPLFLVCFITACTSLKRNPVPVEQIQNAHIAGFPKHIRALGLDKSEALQQDFSKAMVDGGAQQACDTDEDKIVFCVLVISGGGGYGAYGAGFLKGWTLTGNRPEFKIVTGVSTGGLIAPFAFLGSDWDDELESAYTTIENQSYIVEQRNLLGLFWSDSITTVSPLKNLLDTHITEALIDAIAAEYQSGRRLYIGTSNLDSQTFTVWNMGAIASEGGDKAVELFKQVLLASASIPILMPTTLFEVNIDGKSYDEMHADGGVNTQFFIPLRVINLNEAIENAQDNGFQFTPRPRMYIIRNARFVPHPKVVDRNLASITEGTITSMVQAMGRADLYQIFSIARARGNDFRYTEVPEDFEWQSEDEFNGPEMRRLFSIGVEQGLHQDPWKRTPPGLYHLNSGD